MKYRNSWSINNRLVSSSRHKNSWYQHSALKESYKTGGELREIRLCLGNSALGILHRRCHETTACMACGFWGEDRALPPAWQHSHYHKNTQRNKGQLSAASQNGFFVPSSHQGVDAVTQCNFHTVTSFHPKYSSQVTFLTQQQAF